MPIRPETTGWVENTTNFSEDDSDFHSRKSHPSRHCPLGLDQIVSSLKNDIPELVKNQEKSFSEITNSLKQLNDSLLNPDKGLYARIKDLEFVNDLKDVVLDPNAGLISRVKVIEQSRAAMVKWVWIATTALTGAVVVGIIKLLF